MLARLVNGLEKKWNACFWIMFTTDDLPGWLMNSNPICHPSPTKKMKCSIFGLHSTSDDQPGWSMDLNPIHHASPAKNMKCSFLDFVQLLMISQAGQWTRTPSATPLQPKKWNAHFCITINFWFRLDWSMDSNPIHHPSPTNKMKCLILDYAQLLMIDQAGWWTQTPSAIPLKPKTWNACFCITFNIWCWPGCSMDSNPICHPLQPKKWNPHFWIMFNFWWSARLVNGLEPHLPPLSTQKSEMLIFGLNSTSDDWPGWLMDSNPIHHNSLQSKNEMLIFGLCSTSDDQPGWSMDSNPICHPSPAKKMKCSFLDYVQLPIIGLAGRWTQTPSASPLQLIKWNAHFWNTFNFWWSAWVVDGLKPHLPALSSQENEMLLFGLRSTSDDWLG